jgi:hypothetical protein
MEVMLRLVWRVVLCGATLLVVNASSAANVDAPAVSPKALAIAQRTGYAPVVPAPADDTLNPEEAQPPIHRASG